MNGAASEYLPGTEKRKVFTLAPAAEDLTSVILTTRLQVIEDRALSLGARLLFVYLLDLSLRRSVNVKCGVVTISLTKLAEKLNTSNRTVWRWKCELINAHAIWLSQQFMPNMWPLDTYHITNICPPDVSEQKMTPEGMWGNGDRRAGPDKTGLGAREPGQLHVRLAGVRRHQCPRSPGEAENAKTPANATVSRQKCLLSVDTSVHGEPSPVSTGSRHQCPRGAVTSVHGEPSPVSTGSRHQCPRGAVTDGEHKKALEGRKESSRGGERSAEPPQGEKWTEKLSKLFPRELRELKRDLEQQRKAADPADRATIGQIDQRIEAVEVQLYGGKAPKPANARKAPAPAAPYFSKEATPDELLEGARYLLSIGKEKLLTAKQRELVAAQKI